MATAMRAKMKLGRIERFEGQEVLHFQAVTNAKPEDNTFSKWTPTASLTMTITNPDLIGKFAPGEAYYLDFSPAE